MLHGNGRLYILAAAKFLLLAAG